MRLSKRLSRIQALIGVGVLGLGLVLSACSGAPAAKSSSTTGSNNASTTGTGAATNGTPMATRMPMMNAPTGTPLAQDLAQLHAWLGEVQTSVQQTRQQASQMTPEQRQKVQTQLTALVGELGQTYTDMQAAYNQLSPQQKQQVDTALQQVRTSVNNLQQQVMMGTPIASRTPLGTRVATGQVDPMQVGQQLDQIRQRLQTAKQQMDAAQMQQFMDSLTTVVSQTNQLVTAAQAAFSQLTTEQKQKLVMDVQEMRTTALDLQKAAAMETVTPGAMATMSPTETPMGTPAMTSTPTVVSSPTMEITPTAGMSATDTPTPGP